MVRLKEILERKLGNLDFTFSMVCKIVNDAYLEIHAKKYEFSRIALINDKFQVGCFDTNFTALTEKERIKLLKIIIESFEQLEEERK